MTDGDKGALLRQLRIDANQREDSVRAGPPGASGRRVAWIVAALLLVGLGVAAWILFLRPKPPLVETVLAVARAANQTGPSTVLQATGYVVARREATVASQITGTVREVLIEEGRHVEAGQVLARLDDAAYQAAVAQARAQEAAARSQLQQVQVQYAQAKRDLARNEDLVGRDLVSHQALEQTQLALAQLGAQRDAASRQIELATAALHGAEVQLGYCTIRAPFAGVVIARAAQTGETISPISAGGGFTRTGIGTIVDMNSLEIEVDVNESYINKVQPDQKATAVLDAYPDWNIPAHVIAIIPTADRGKATVKVRVALDQKDGRILPDMGVRVSFMDAAPAAAAVAGASSAAAKLPPAVMVPATAVVSDNAVFVVDAGRVHLHTVQVQSSSGDSKAVTGLDVGARVVRAPGADLADGAAVRVDSGKGD